MLVDWWDWLYFHLDCFVANNFVAGLLEEENTNSFLSFLFCFHCFVFSKLTARGRFRISEIQNNFKRGSPRWLSLSLFLLPMKYVLMCLKIGIRQNGNKWHGTVSSFFCLYNTFYELSERPTSKLRNSFNHKKKKYQCSKALPCC